MDWDIDDETLKAMGCERVTVTLDVAELVPGTYVYLGADDETLMRGALVDFDDDFDDEADTIPDGRTIIGRPPDPRGPALARTPTIKGSPIEPRRPVPTPDMILNEIDDDDDIGGRTILGPPMTPRRPAPRRR